jgi:hypothetical protein
MRGLASSALIFQLRQGRLCGPRALPPQLSPPLSRASESNTFSHTSCPTHQPSALLIWILSYYCC